MVLFFVDGFCEIPLYFLLKYEIMPVLKLAAGAAAEAYLNLAIILAGMSDS